MPVTVTQAVSGPYTPNGATVAFPFDFKATAASEVKVVDEDGAEVSSALYAVTINSGEGGTVTFSVAPLLADYTSLYVISDPEMTQIADFGNSGPSFNPTALTRAFDRAAIRDLALQAQIDRTIKVPFGEASSTLPADRAGKFLSFDGSGLPTASSGTGADAGLRTDLAEDSGYSLIGGLPGLLPINVLGFIPAIYHAAIAARTVSANLVSYFDLAAASAVTAGRPLYVPKGTFTMKTWSPPASLTVITDGTETQFRQLDTAVAGTPTAQRFIIVNTDNVRLWPGGACSFDGGMTAGGVNATSFNGFVFCYALAGTTINNFEVGDCYAQDCGGDILEVGADATGRVVQWRAGMLFGENIYQSGASITSGEFGELEAVEGNFGFYALNLEPNPTSPKIKAVTIGRVHGNRISIAGDPTSTLGHIKVGQIHIDGSLADSVPAYPYDTATTQGRGMQYRWADHIEIGQATFENCPYGAIHDIGETGLLWTNELSIDQLKLVNCGATYHYSIVQQRTRKITIGSILDASKASPSDATLISGVAGTLFEVNGGAISGRLGIFAGAVSLKNVVYDGDADTAVFRECAGQAYLQGLTITDVGTLFANVTTAPIIRDCTITATNLIAGTTPDAKLENVTYGGVLYPDNWYTTQAAVASAATITLPKRGNVIPISGTTNITAITADAGHKGRTVTLVFAGVLNFTDGSNLKLASTMATTADDTITISTPDGTTWYEVGRSVN